MIAMLSYFYQKIIRKDIKNLKNYHSFKKILNHFKDSKGIVDYKDLENFIGEFFANPEAVDFDKYEQINKDNLIKEKANRKKNKDKHHNYRHHKTFNKVKN